MRLFVYNVNIKTNTNLIYLHHISKNKQNYFCYNYITLPSNLIIFGTVMAKQSKII